MDKLSTQMIKKTISGISEEKISLLKFMRTRKGKLFHTNKILAISHYNNKLGKRQYSLHEIHDMGRYKIIESDKRYDNNIKVLSLNASRAIIRRKLYMSRYMTNSKSLKHFRRSSKLMNRKMSYFIQNKNILRKGKFIL